MIGLLVVMCGKRTAIERTEKILSLLPGIICLRFEVSNCCLSVVIQKCGVECMYVGLMFMSVVFMC